ncbi:MAG: N-acetylmuramoyl-L-alanine amidase [Candidatus Accumulibacter sp.]|jgi:N-acetylmuramoyl-L-alanine amidase|nr:N-acetylmuramoyl-L-alanine amidase [Accumulibacter sp.]
MRKNVSSAGVSRRQCFGLPFALFCLLTACTPPAPRPLADAAIRVERSPNFDARRPNLVVLHHTSDGSLDEALSVLTDPRRRVSAHYLVGRDGEIVRLVDEKERAWHAGVSWWGGNTDINSSSIGIELDNDGFEPFPGAQIDALLLLLTDLTRRYDIPGANVVGHADVAPDRKVDPSVRFPWRRLAEHGFGLWCDDPPPAPEALDLTLALAALGYSPLTPEASRQAFLRHYVGGRTLSDAEERALAWCLFQKTGDRGQGTGNRGQRTEDRGQRTVKSRGALRRQILTVSCPPAGAGVYAITPRLPERIGKKRLA